MASDTKPKTNVETHKFGAQTDKILQLMIHSLYAHKDIFLRELISNASDACDKLRYQAITKPELLKDDSELKIQITASEKDATLTIEDNGIGMNHEELVENLGTIARSGTQHFLEAATGDAKKDIQLIGQFGVGFYSSFMVADNVSVTSTKAGSNESWTWESKGDGEYTITPATEKKSRGTKITLHLKEEAKEFTDKHRINHIVTTYSDHIAFPTEFTDEDGNTENINKGAALWTKSKSEITKEQYTEFYHHVAHTGDEPWMTFHNKAEGTIEYTNLLFIPSNPPFDLFQPERQTRVKLYVKRVFISEGDLGIIPRYLRFVKGIIDSEDLPLNISRETLQHNNLVHKISNAVTKRILNELKNKAEKEPEEFEKFWNNFGAVLKEGLCESIDANRELLMEVCRFKTTKSGDKLISLDDYIKNMKKDQDKIYYLIGDNIETLQKSPQLEGFLKKDIEVILFTDSVDDFWLTINRNYKEKELISITRSGIELEDEKDEKKSTKNKKDDSNEEEQKNTIELFKSTLGEKVQDVVISKKLSDSPVCITVPEGGMDIRMERFLIEQKQLAITTPKILEINPSHPLIQHIGTHGKNKNTKELIEILFDQACIVEGETIQDPSAFATRLNTLLKKIVNG